MLSREVHGQGFPGWTSGSTNSTLNSLTDHMFCLNVALNIASSTRVEITLQTKPHPQSTLLHILAN